MACAFEVVNSFLRFSQSMVVGQLGESGVVVVPHVAVAFKRAHELAPTPLLEMVEPLAKGIAYSLKLAIPMDAQVNASRLMEENGCGMRF